VIKMRMKYKDILSIFRMMATWQCIHNIRRDVNGFDYGNIDRPSYYYGTTSFVEKIHGHSATPIQESQANLSVPLQVPSKLRSVLSWSATFFLR